MNNETQEMEIDLKKTLYRVCRRWRAILIFGIVAALAVAAFQAVKSCRAYLDPEAYAFELDSFQREYNKWNSTEATINSRIEVLELQKRAQQEYNERSVLMKLKPDAVIYQRCTIYVDSFYSIYPNLI